MKILLVGEFSGFYNSLKDGLRELGHDVLLASMGDGYKDLPSDILWDSRYLGYWGVLERSMKVIKTLHLLKGYDVVQFVNPEIFLIRFGFNKFVLNEIIKNNGKSFLTIAGDLVDGWNYWKNPLENNIKYSWIPDYVKYDLNGVLPNWLKSKTHLKWEKDMMLKMDGIIPVMYEYSVPYRKYPNLRQTLPLPINTHKIKYFNNNVSKKIIVFHGLNRYGFKGTRFVEKAFEILNKKYPNDLELIIDGKLPYNKYIELLSRANIVIDQTNSYSLGMNALIAMAMGKVVLGGAEPESIKEMGYNYCPAINIIPNEKDIVSKIEMLLDQRKDITDIGFRSRKFIEEYHDYLKVAQQYLKVWNNPMITQNSNK